MNSSGSKKLAYDCVIISAMFSYLTAQTFSLLRSEIRMNQYFLGLQFF